MKIIELSSSDKFLAPAHFVKKPDGSLRMVVDYRKLNENIRRTPAHLPSISSITWAMKDKEVFSSIDMKHGFYSLPLADEASKDATTFSVGSNLNLGCYRFTRTPMGSTISPSNYVSLSNVVMAGMPSNVLNYMDDYLIATEPSLDSPGGIEAHLELLERLFDRIRQANLRISPSKCKLFKSEVDYLGFNFSKEGLNISPRNIAKIRNLKEPRNKRQVRGFLGTTGYLRRSIPGYAQLANPLTQLTKDDGDLYGGKNRDLLSKS